MFVNWEHFKSSSTRVPHESLHTFGCYYDSFHITTVMSVAILLNSSLLRTIVMTVDAHSNWTYPPAETNNIWRATYEEMSHSWTEERGDHREVQQHAGGRRWCPSTCRIANCCFVVQVRGADHFVDEGKSINICFCYFGNVDQKVPFLVVQTTWVTR